MLETENGKMTGQEYKERYLYIDPENIGVAVGILSLCALELEMCLWGHFTPVAKTVAGRRVKQGHFSGVTPGKTGGSVPEEERLRTAAADCLHAGRMASLPVAQPTESKHPGNHLSPLLQKMTNLTY